MIKVTFYSNFLNHHQLPFCLEMYKMIGDNFKFVATSPIDKERLDMGYADMKDAYPFSLNTYENIKNYEYGLYLGIESDVVIIGSAPSIFIEKRLEINKLTFYYSERIFKKGQWRVLYPRIFFSFYKHHTKYNNNKLYMLCASAYTPCDFNLVGAYRNKTLKWGYFPETKKYNIENLLTKKRSTITKILWVGRFIKWKHPEHAIQVAKLLKKEGYKFKLDFIGTGEKYDYINNLIEKYNLSDCINILGSMNPEEVRKQMELSNIFLFTSDYNEGWGAVLNESMNSGCAVVASSAIGSVPYLIKNERNGLIYKNGKIKDLFKCVKRLLDDRNLCEQLGAEAYKTLETTWTAKVAAERFIKLSEEMLEGKKIVYKDGPCSKADIIKQRDMFNYLKLN